ncbi:DNA-3-methyladenine glycosylase I [Lacimicrobium alkaliphilum]|uniref:DNA-3-methyladenine glycosylase I n=1 Tax=Lacimicrobium alkaliphilum TaxID=1526571 RepID=A0ABQ1RL35_9ALTE|nr:DNA-3-methyladenine glycosylase I [Lacimicrobium alkaliphilum]GGD71933.1 DNA-3-methyladenine glycosylase I [Lacimicrobium alkaliphilum]
MSDPRRCHWVTQDPLYLEYHDNVWGRPVSDARELFAKLCLDGQQAGLSWLTILKKQANYELAFDHFDADKIARFDEHDIQRLMQNAGIVRNRLKIESIIRNARAYVAMSEKGIDFSDFIWHFTGGHTVRNAWQLPEQVPVTTDASDAMSRSLKKQGFNFVGSTICYAFMQAVGMVNDHLTDCHCYEEVSALGR